VLLGMLKIPFARLRPCDRMLTRVRSALLCDDVRVEATQKLILIGVYGGEVVASVRPCVVPVTIALQLDTDGSGADLEIKTEGGGFGGRWNPQVPPGVSIANLQISAQIIMLEERDLRLFIRNKGDADWRSVAEWTFRFHPEVTDAPVEHAADIEEFAKASREARKNAPQD
jgi:hypothetical protein